MFVIPIESNPEVSNIQVVYKMWYQLVIDDWLILLQVMTKFLIKLGVPSNVQVVDVYSLDPEMLPFVTQPVAALILLFPYNEKVK